MENSVSEWPALDGRFACFSGVKFSFDPEQAPLNRVHSVMTSADTPFDLSPDAYHIIAVKYYIALGKDGYSAFKDPRVEWLNDPESALMIRDVVF